MSEIERAKIVRETEKAVLVNVMFGDEFRKDVWFPKSQIKVDGGRVFAPAWLLDAKANEIGRNVPNIATVFVEA